MSTYLLTWNPDRWHWPNLAEAAALTTAGTHYHDKWSCGNTKSIHKGDRVFLLRQGEEPTGIMAAGYVTSDECFLAPHWDATLASKGAQALRVNVEFERVLDPDTQLLPLDRLQSEHLASVHWSTIQSGIPIDDRAAAELEQLWTQHLSQLGGIRGDETVRLQRVNGPEEVYASLLNFNRQAAGHPKRARSLLRTTEYWVFHPSSGLFGPGKFVGYQDMSFEWYEEGHLGHTSGERFDGHTTRNNIQSALSGIFRPNSELGERLAEWGHTLLGLDAFGHADHAKWKFMVLDTPGLDEQVDAEVAEAAEISQSKGQGFQLNAALRKAIEDYAMVAARRWFEEQGYSVEDHHLNHPYDLFARRGGEEVYVEVKGTQSLGEDIILTRGEVEFAQQHKGQMALFIYHSIKVSGSENEPILSGGERKLVMPWDVDLGGMTVISYMYAVPG